MKEFLKGKKTYITIGIMVLSMALSHFSPVKVSSDELQAIATQGADIYATGKRDLWPMVMGLVSSLAAIWARRRTDIEAVEDYAAGLPPRALNPKTGSPFKAGLFILAGCCIFLLPSCKNVSIGGDALKNITPYVGEANVMAAEIAIGGHALGIGATYRRIPNFEAVEEVEPNPPYIHPLDQK